MSLILEALRKLDREKQAPERGLVVTGATTWARPEGRRAARLAWVLLAGAALALGLWLLRGRVAHAPPEKAAAGKEAPAAVAAAPTDALGAPAGDTSSAASGPAPGAAVRVPPPAAQAADVTPGAAAASASRAAAEPPASGPSEPPTVADAAVVDDQAEAPSAPPASHPPAAAETPAAGDGRVVLQAVSERDGQPVAIVNGRLAREGDSFDGITILRIRPTEIEVEVDGQRRIVSF